MVTTIMRTQEVFQDAEFDIQKMVLLCLIFFWHINVNLGMCGLRSVRRATFEKLSANISVFFSKKSKISMLMIGNFENGLAFSSNSWQFYKKKFVLIVIVFQELKFKHHEKNVQQKTVSRSCLERYLSKFHNGFSSKPMNKLNFDRD